MHTIYLKYSFFLESLEAHAPLTLFIIQGLLDLVKGIFLIIVLPQRINPIVAHYNITFKFYSGFYRNTGEPDLPVGFAKIKEIVVLAIGAAFKIFDTYSDMFFAYVLYTGKYAANCHVDPSPDHVGNKCYLKNSKPVFAIATILPMFICFLFTTSYWWKVSQ